MAKIVMSDVLPEAEIAQAQRQMQHLAKRAKRWGPRRNLGVVAFTNAARLLCDALEEGRRGMRFKPVDAPPPPPK